jgi:hypothetical protein
MKKRINISLGPELHARAVAHAKAREMDFSELLAHLLRAELDGAAKPTAPAPVPVANPVNLARQVQKLKPGRNDGCPCGSGRKFKKCCEPTWPLLKARPAAAGG